MSTHDRRAQLAKLLSPASIAVVGASERARSWGRTTVENLDGIGFGGQVYPVNPRYEKLAGRPCFPSLRDLPEVPDAVAIAVPAAQVPATITEAIDCGVGAAVVYASGFGAPGEGEGGATGPDGLRAQLTQICAAKQIAVQGPNCLGIANYSRRAAMWGITMPFAHAGTDHGVAMIAQSGNMSLTLSGASRGYALTHLVSCGNQLDVTAAELIEASLADPAVRAIAVIIESIPDIGRFRDALTEAADHDIPVVVLKVGNSERARLAAIAHTGSLSGPAAVHQSFFRQFGAIQVSDLDELAATLAVLSSPSRPRRSGVVLFAASGGECGVAADIAESVGAVMPEVPSSTAAEIAGLLPNYAHVANPLDLTAGGWGDAALYAKIIPLLASIPGVGAVVGVGDAPTLEHGDGELEATYDGIVDGLAAGAELVREQGTTVAGLSSITDLHHGMPRALTARGVVPLAGLRQGLAGLARAGWYADWRARRAQEQGAASDGGAAERVQAVRSLISGRPDGPVPDDLAKRVLACYGIASPEREIADSPEAAAKAAGRIGFPVVLKVSAAGIQHKTDVGGVLLNLGTAAAVTDGAAALLQLGRSCDPDAAVLVERFVTGGGLELIIGGRQDEAFGPLVVAGLGGVLTELLSDVAHRLAPVTPAEAEDMLGELAGRRLLDGYRGRSGAPVTGVAAAVAALSQLLAEHPRIAEIDVNPIVADPAEAGALLALDALLVLRSPH